MSSQKDLASLGESIHLDADVYVTEEQAQQHILLSHIPVPPLDSLMSPEAIVEKNRIHIAQQGCDIWEDSSFERTLHELLHCTYVR